MTRISPASPMTGHRRVGHDSCHARHCACRLVVTSQLLPPRRWGAHPRGPGDRRSGLRRDPRHQRAALRWPPAGTPPAAPPPAGPPPEERTTAPPAAAAGTAPARPPRATVPPDPKEGWAVQTRALTKRFGSNGAVDDVELRVPRGSAFGYLGPNGAGKTTLIRTLLGLTRASSGTMSLLGIPVPAERRRALARVGAIVDEPRFHHHLTGRENLRLLAAARGGDADERIPGSLVRVGLGER